MEKDKTNKWKEFFKLTKSKIVLMIFIVLLNFFLLALGKVGSSIALILDILPIWVFGHFSVPAGDVLNTSLFADFMLFFTYIVEIYLVSCIIVFLTNKLKGGEMKNKNISQIEEFFKPNWWKIVLTLVIWIIFGFMVGWQTCNAFIGGSVVCSETYFLGIRDNNTLMILSFIFFYLVFSTIIFFINKLKGGKT